MRSYDRKIVQCVPSNFRVDAHAFAGHRVESFLDSHLQQDALLFMDGRWSCILANLSLILGAKDALVPVVFP